MAWFDWVLGTDEERVIPLIKVIQHKKPELKGKLRVVPVIVDITEMPADEANALRERRRALAEELEREIEDEQ